MRIKIIDKLTRDRSRLLEDTINQMQGKVFQNSQNLVTTLPIWNSELSSLEQALSDYPEKKSNAKSKILQRCCEIFQSRYNELSKLNFSQLINYLNSLQMELSEVDLLEGMVTNLKQKSYNVINQIGELGLETVELEERSSDDKLQA